MRMVDRAGGTEFSPADYVVGDPSIHNTIPGIEYYYASRFGENKWFSGAMTRVKQVSKNYLNKPLKFGRKDNKPSTLEKTKPIEKTVDIPNSGDRES